MKLSYYLAPLLTVFGTTSRTQSNPEIKLPIKEHDYSVYPAPYGSLVSVTAPNVATDFESVPPLLGNTPAPRMAPDVAANLEDVRPAPDSESSSSTRSHVCTICGKAAAYKSALSIHMRIHTGEKPFRCTQPGCNKAFIRRGNLTQHMRVHTGEKPFKCAQPGCNKAFIRREHLTQHMRVHTGEKPFKCAICNKEFTRKYCLNVHLKTKSHLEKVAQSNSGSLASVTAPDVATDFESAHPLLGNTATLFMSTSSSARSNDVSQQPQKTQKRVPCEICAQTFATKYSLQDHRARQHGLGEARFRCSICNKICDRKNKLVDHMRTHTVKKPFKCTICNKAFARRDRLAAHSTTKYHLKKVAQINGGN